MISPAVPFVKRMCCVIAAIACSVVSYAQLPDGTTAPDFTFTDINGVVQNLYTYLNEGKYVAIDISATWCVPCWNYHNTHVLDSLYALHDIPGDNTWKIMFIEGDGSTDSADLYGTGTNTVGNWVAGSEYEIMNPPSGTALTNFLNDYDVYFFPMFYLICPDKKLIQDTLNAVKPGVAGWEYAADNLCKTTSINTLDLIPSCNIYPNPATGSVMIQFELDKSIDMSLSVVNYMGTTLANKELGYLCAGSHSIEYEAANLKPGMYIFKLSGVNCNEIIKRVVIQ